MLQFPCRSQVGAKKYRAVRSRPPIDLAMFEHGPNMGYCWILQCFWVNLITTSLLIRFINVNKGNHPQMAARFRLVKYYTLPICFLCSRYTLGYINSWTLKMTNFQWKHVETNLLTPICQGRTANLLEGNRYNQTESTHLYLPVYQFQHGTQQLWDLEGKFQHSNLKCL